MKIDFCIPVLNEEKILKKNILKIYNFLFEKKYDFDWSIVIVDNGSSDKTEEIINELIRKYKKIKKINLDKQGKGRAVKACWQQSDSDFFVYMDVDLAVSLDNLDGLLYPLINENFDLVFGSRLLPESQTDRCFFRSLSSRCYIFLSKIILGHSFSDLQCGFKGAKTKILKQKTNLIKDNNWFFDTELVCSFFYSNLKIKEIPVSWKEDRYEQRKSKINVFKEGIVFLKKLWQLKKRFKKL